MNGVASYTAPLRLADLPAMLSIIIPAEEKTNIYVLLLEKSRGDSHMKGARVLVASLRGVNFGFRSQGVLGKTPLYLAVNRNRQL